MENKGVKRGRFPMTKAQFEKKKKAKNNMQQIVQVVQSIAEKKFFDYTFGAAMFNFSGAGTVSYMSNVLQGNTSLTRVGKKIGITSIHIRCSVRPSTTTEQGFLRYRVFFDSQTNGVAPIGTDILVTDALQALPNTVNYSRFKTVWDKTLKITGVSGSSGGDTQLQFIDEYIKFKEPQIVHYNTGTAGTVADNVNGSLWIATWAYGLATASPVTVGTSRIRFIDF